MRLRLRQSLLTFAVSRPQRPSAGGCLSTVWRQAAQCGRHRGHCRRWRWCPMTLARTHSIAIAGVQGHVIEIEADIENGLVGLQLIGLPDTALRGARGRTRSAVVKSGPGLDERRVTVGLSPASLPKRGSGFDVAIAVAVLSADGMLPDDCLAGTVFVGELGL